MTIDANWLSRLLLSPAPINAALEQQVNAAVLLPIWQTRYGWQLLLTRRAMHLKHHPGQLSFPGGRLEAGESALQAALRETHEEIGIATQHIQILSSLPALSTATGFVVKPWLGLLKNQPKMTLQTSEVDSVLALPLHYVLASTARRSIALQLRGKQQLLHFIPWQQRLLWGASAAILVQMSEQIGYPPPQRLS